jgi:hypothetical protein
VCGYRKLFKGKIGSESVRVDLSCFQKKFVSNFFPPIVVCLTRNPVYFVYFVRVFLLLLSLLLLLSCFKYLFKIETNNKIEFEKDKHETKHRRNTNNVHQQTTKILNKMHNSAEEDCEAIVKVSLPDLGKLQ